VDKLLEKLKKLQDACNLEVMGVQIIRTFMERRIQPLQARSRGMWEYSGSSDPTRVSSVDYSPSELETKVKNVTKLKSDDDFPGPLPVAPFGEDNPIPEVIFLSSVPLLLVFFTEFS